MAHPLNPVRYGRVPTTERRSPARRLSVVSALLILAGGYVHFCLYRKGYRFIPKIGISFLLQFSSSAVLGAALLMRDRLVRLGRHLVAVTQLIRLSAVGLSIGTLAALGVAHTSGGLFNFREIGLRPAPQTIIAIGVESLATILLTVAMLQVHGMVRAESSRGSVAPPRRQAMADAA
jgi:hypothetical protein